MAEPLVIDVYLHASKESMRDYGEQHGLTGEALDYFAHACNEVRLTLAVDPATGEARIVKVEGRPLQES